MLWDKSPARTLAYIVEAAEAAEKLRLRWPDRVVFVVGQELTLFMQGIVPGKSLVARLRNPSFGEALKTGAHNAPLNAFRGRAVEAVRRVYHGPLTYAAVIWEAVDWSRFDIIGVDHYRDPRINDRYVEMLAPATPAKNLLSPKVSR